MELIQRRRQLMGMQTRMDENMKLVKTYTIQESWEDLSKGNTQNAYNTILKDLVEQNTAYNTYVAVFENNQASQVTYKADYMVATGFGPSALYFQSVRNERSVYATALNSTRQFFASQGTVVKVYALY